jgi:fumarate reductase subunit D
MARTNEPIWWSLFGAGGMIAAVLTPVTVIITGIAVPAGWITAYGLDNLVHHPLSRLYLFLLIAFPLFHAAHRLLFTLVDLGLKGMRGALAVLLYGGAILGTLVAAALLIRL